MKTDKINTTAPTLKKEVENSFNPSNYNLQELTETYIEQKYNDLYQYYIAFPIEVIEIIIEFESKINNFKTL